MIEFIDTKPQINVLESEYKRLLGYPVDYRLTDRARELADQTIAWYAEHGRPWVYARETEGVDLKNGNVSVGSMEFHSKRLHDQLSDAEAHNAILTVVSAGRECEERARELWKEEKPDEYFFMEMYGSAVVEHLVQTTGARFCAWADEQQMVVLPHYSPGYPEWDVADQSKLLTAIINGQNYDFPESIEVMPTGMLNLKKSLLALFGITKRIDKVENLANLVPCENCSLPACQYRRAPYKHSMKQIEDVCQLQTNLREYAQAKPVRSSPLSYDAKYSISRKALRKWSHERLRMTRVEDGSYEVRFQYEGTTCSNLGRPIEYFYRVRIGPAEQGYAISEMHCAPAPGDTGYTFQCEFLSDPDGLTHDTENEKPLLGQPLNDVLTWQRDYNPSGCFCDVSRRMHKWGLVLEVIHYTLVQFEKHLLGEITDEDLTRIIRTE